MKDQIKDYIKERIEGLESGEQISLQGVYPQAIEEVIGGFENELDLNGWQGDYWTGNGEYEVSGCMYYGYATIVKK